MNVGSDKKVSLKKIGITSNDIPLQYQNTSTSVSPMRGSFKSTEQINSFSKTPNR